MGNFGDVVKNATHSISEVEEAIWAHTMGVVDHFLESGRQADQRLADRGLQRRGDMAIELTLVLVLLALPPAIGFVAGRMTRPRRR